jgi:hypothetical protein
MSMGHWTWSLHVRLALSRLWLAVRVGGWLYGLPRRMRVYSMPQLLHRLSPAQGQMRRHSSLPIEQVVRIVRRVCRLQCFRGAPFPRPCLRKP